MTEPRSWPMFGVGADREDDATHWYAFGSRRYVELYDCGTPVPVLLVEDADGDHRGWIDTNQAPRPVLVQHRRIFDIQFPYGSKAEVERGRGQVVCLRVEPRVLAHWERVLLEASPRRVLCHPVDLPVVRERLWALALSPTPQVATSGDLYLPTEEDEGVVYIERPGPPDTGGDVEIPWVRVGYMLDDFAGGGSDGQA